MNALNSRAFEAAKREGVEPATGKEPVYRPTTSTPARGEDDRRLSIQSKATITPRAAAPAPAIRPTHEDFRDQYTDPAKRPNSTATPNTRAAEAHLYQPAAAARPTPHPSSSTRRPRRGRWGSKLVSRRLRRRLGPRRIFATVRVSAVNTWIWSFGLFTWAFFQMPVAVLAVVFLGLAAAVEDLLRQAEARANENGMIETVIGVTLKISTWILKQFTTLFGIDLTLLNPATLFFISHFFVFALGIITLLTIYFIYLAAFVRPLSGRAAGVKMATLLLAVIGYAVPVANLFPWFIFWTMAVWRYPT